jgi:hypothetical protein
MKKFLTVLVAAALSGVAVVGTSSSADARWGGGWGYRGVGCCGGGWGYRGLGWGQGGFAAGAAIGAALATPYLLLVYRHLTPYDSGGRLPTGNSH